jgi:hypothetical protein
MHCSPAVFTEFDVQSHYKYGMNHNLFHALTIMELVWSQSPPLSQQAYLQAAPGPPGQCLPFPKMQQMLGCINCPESEWPGEWQGLLCGLLQMIFNLTLEYLVGLGPTNVILDKTHGSLSLVQAPGCSELPTAREVSQVKEMAEFMGLLPESTGTNPRKDAQTSGSITTTTAKTGTECLLAISALASNSGGTEAGEAKSGNFSLDASCERSGFISMPAAVCIGENPLMAIFADCNIVGLALAADLDVSSELTATCPGSSGTPSASTPAATWKHDFFPVTGPDGSRTGAMPALNSLDMLLATIKFEPSFAKLLVSGRSCEPKLAATVHENCMQPSVSTVLISKEPSVVDEFEHRASVTGNRGESLQVLPVPIGRHLRLAIPALREPLEAIPEENSFSSSVPEHVGKVVPWLESIPNLNLSETAKRICSLIPYFDAYRTHLHFDNSRDNMPPPLDKGEPKHSIVGFEVQESTLPYRCPILSPDKGVAEANEEAAVPALVGSNMDAQVAKERPRIAEHAPPSEDEDNGGQGSTQHVASEERDSGAQNRHRVACPHPVTLSDDLTARDDGGGDGHPRTADAQQVASDTGICCQWHCQTGHGMASRNGEHVVWRIECCEPSSEAALLWSVIASCVMSPWLLDCNL